MRFLNQFIFVLLLTIVVYIQAYVLAPTSSQWLKIDLISVFVCYVAMERNRIQSMLQILFVTLLVSSMSAAPSGFFGLYHLVVLVASVFVLKIILVRDFLSHSLFLLFALCSKYTLIYFTIESYYSDFSFGRLLQTHAIGMISTLISMPLFFSLLKLFDRKFPCVDVSFREVRF